MFESLDLRDLWSALSGTNIPLPTLVAMAVIGYLGYSFVRKVTSVAWNIISGTAGKAGAGIAAVFGAMHLGGLLAMTTAGTLFIGGLTASGYGVGELRTGPTDTTERRVFTNSELIKLVKDSEKDTAAMKTVLDYAQARQDNTTSFVSTQAELSVAEPNGDARLGYLSFFGGIGAMLVGLIMFLVRESRIQETAKR